MSLTIYQRKRKFAKTPEPAEGKVRARSFKGFHFVVQEHHASHLHWDFRLEMEGVLKSWAIPKGPSMDPRVKHLAVHVEDHPLEYRKFHGTIPEGNYGAGKVIIWDSGTYEPAEPTETPEKTLLQGLKKGDLKFILHGKKLQGEFALVKFRKEGKNWLLLKKHESGETKQTSMNNGKKSSMPHHISPMLAQTAKEPFDDPDWVFETKWDGYRAIAEVHKGSVRLYSRNHQNFTTTYPDIVEAIAKITHDVVLDGEIVALDTQGRAQFQLLQESLKNLTIQQIYYVFDLLYLDGYDLRTRPLTERKELLQKLLPEGKHLKYSDHIVTYGKKLFALAKKKQIEGIMAKKKESPYLQTRSNNWLKIKNIEMTEAVICGFTKPRGTRKQFGALILGMYDGRELRYIGHTGGGFDEKQLDEVMSLLSPLITETSPFAHIPKTNAPATWVKPKLVCQIKFHEWTNEGIMRQPIFLVMRSDKKPEDVTREQQAVTPPKMTKESKRRGTTNVELSNLEKVFWPKEKYTKGDVINYYERMASYILPYLKDRPESLNRHPDGITGISFYQKDVTSVPKWVKTVSIHSDTDNKMVHWVVCNDTDTLLYLANLGCIELNPWSSRVKKKEHPDYLIIDLDPNGVPFTEVVRTVKVVKTILDNIQATGFVKTSGKTGMHILIPLGARYTFDQTRKFAELLARAVSQALPKTTSVTRNPQKREKKVYIDFLQNRIGQTITAPYSIRPVPGACVSTPLHWKEVTKRLTPKSFTIKNMQKRLKKQGDIWKPLLSHKGINMKRSLHLLTNHFPL